MYIKCLFKCLKESHSHFTLFVIFPCLCYISLNDSVDCGWCVCEVETSIHVFLHSEMAYNVWALFFGLSMLMYLCGVVIELACE